MTSDLENDLMEDLRVLRYAAPGNEFQQKRNAILDKIDSLITAAVREEQEACNKILRDAFDIFAHPALEQAAEKIRSRSKP